MGMPSEILTTSTRLLLLAAAILITLSGYYLIDPEHQLLTSCSQAADHLSIDTSSNFSSHSNYATIGTQSHAVVHMGPPKTGSTTIQTTSRILKDYLYLDGFEMPWEVRLRKHDERPILQKSRAKENQIHLASCFFVDATHRDRATCDPDLLLYGSDIAARNRNLFVSNEGISQIRGEGINLLAQYLSQWDRTTIVVFYRRFYDLIASQYNQHRKVRRLEETSKWETSILDYISLRLDRIPRNQVSNLTQRLQEKFDHILVLNLHDRSRGGPDESLFCDPAVNMPQTCKAIRGRNETLHSNEKVNLDYSDLAYGAKMAGMVEIKSDEEMDRISVAVRNHHLGGLNGTAFARVCPPQAHLDLLWKKTHEVEAMYYPERVDSVDNDLKSDFEKSSTTKLCKVDVENTLGEKKWRNFFKKLNS